jgi:O-methyltransferase
MKYPKLKKILTRVGARCSPSHLHLLNGLFNYMNIGHWFRQNGFQLNDIRSSRKELYEHLAGLTKGPVSYLEFGVFRGDSMRIWSSVLKDPGSSLDGFDSFEGLPEDWRLAADKSTFDVEGAIPIIDDTRVSFHKGWFSDTLPGFLKAFQPKGQLVVHLDADLYSSTKYVMDQLLPLMVRGTILIFDELFDRDHELRALDEFIVEHSVGLECVGATPTLTQAAFLIVKPPVRQPERAG